MSSISPRTHFLPTPNSPSQLVELTSGDHLACALGALGHDAGHRGYTNPYEVATRSDLALRYNDISVLEMHHAAMTSEALRESGIQDLFTRNE